MRHPAGVAGSVWARAVSSSTRAMASRAVGSAVARVDRLARALGSRAAEASSKRRRLSPKAA